MSVIRAVTQLIKARSIVNKKLLCLDEEKKAQLDAIEDKYIGKHTHLKQQFNESHNALLALGYTEEMIANITDEFLKEERVDDDTK